jgi:transposase InsO family protein
MNVDEKNMSVAAFRFGIISEFVTGLHLDYGEKENLIEEKISRQYKIPESSKTKISRSTIQGWISNYRDSGNKITGLIPKKRKDKGIFKSLNPSIQMAIKEIKRNFPEITGIALVSQLQHQRYLSTDEYINLSVLYRFLKKEDLQRPKLMHDRRSFEAALPNEMWQSDVLHGPLILNGHKKIKCYLIAIIDDHSRLIIHAKFFLTEGLADFKLCLKAAIEKRGLPQKLYIDNGSCYKAINLEQITACLGIGIAHTPPYTPQGRGKIERWFRYVRESFLCTCPSEITLDEINELLDDWVETYNHKIHSTTEQTPIKRYQENMKCVRPAPKDLMSYFRMIEFRKVKKDRTIKLNGTTFEVPVELIDLRVELKFHKEFPEEVEIFLDGRSFGMAELLDRNVNFKIGRNYKISSELKEKDIKSGELFQGKKS